MFDKLKKIVFGQSNVSQERSADHAFDRLEEILGSAKRKENNTQVVFQTIQSGVDGRTAKSCTIPSDL